MFVVKDGLLVGVKFWRFNWDEFDSFYFGQQNNIYLV